MNYTKTINKHNFGASLLAETYEINVDALGAQGVGFLPNVKVLNGSTTPESVSGSFT